VNPAFQATATFAPVAHMPSRIRPSRAGEWLRSIFAPVGRIPEEHIDRSTGLYNRAGLFAAANELLRSRAADAPVSAILIDFADLREVRDIYDNAIAGKVVDRMIRRVRCVAGRRGLLGRTGPSQFTVVLPDAAAERALRCLQRGLGKPARVEFDAGDSEIVLVPDLVIDTAEPGEDRIQPLYRDMCGELARIRNDERRRMKRLTSERERHSRPMSLPPRLD
jgi:diguanylate cyclase (GGDEF)-like protein